MPSNQEIAKIFKEIADFLEIKEVPFKPRAYRRAARAIEALGEPVADIYQKQGLKGLDKISNVGSHIAFKIEELLKTGRLQYYENLKKELPVEVEELTAIEGLGTKTVKKLYDALKIRNLDDLEKAVKLGKIRKVEGLSQKSETKILKGLEFLKKSQGRFLLADIEPLAQKIKERLQSLSSRDQVVIAGSYRRRKETVGDLDIVAVSKNPKKLMQVFISMPEVVHIYAAGPTKSLIRIKPGIDVDLRAVPPESLGAMLLAFTGSKDHEIALRTLAEKQGFKLNDFGLLKGRKLIASRTEKSVYEALGLKYIEPELRENQGEIEAAQLGRLPNLIGYSDIKGDLQIHTKASDGDSTLEEMAEAARELGLEYIAVTDHSQGQRVAGGQTWSEIQKQWKQIDRLNRELKDFRVLKSAEVEIKKDGSLDFPDSQLKQFDLVLGAVHSYFNLNQNEQTQRIIKAMENPFMDILVHPTGRRIPRRPAYELDMEAIAKTAARTGTILEINAQPTRLDLKDVHIKTALEAGARLVISTDAHNKQQLHYLKYGIAQARRGWAEPENIVNTLPLQSFLKSLKRNKIE
jgi:DNA polymerase (family 10)